MTAILAALGAAFVAGAMNAMAGGGTLVTFPTLVALGLDPRIANATSTVGLWMGALGGVFGFRRELRSPLAHQALRRLLLPATVGAALGAWLLVSTPSVLFQRVAPFLVLGATLTFALQDRVRRFSADVAQAVTPRARFALVLAETVIAAYGTYFGAGLGILLLTVFAAAGVRDLKLGNAVKAVLIFLINGVGGVLFAFSGVVDWPSAAAIAAGSFCGGIAGASLSRRLPVRAVRASIIVVGLTVGTALLLRME